MVLAAGTGVTGASVPWSSEHKHHTFFGLPWPFDSEALRSIMIVTPYSEAATPYISLQLIGKREFALSRCPVVTMSGVFSV
jgi:hypothetical protein